MDRGIFTNEVIGYTTAGLALGAGIGVLVLLRRRKRKTPEELEALRRTWLSENGKLGGGEIVEVQDVQIAYLYDVRGITYNTSQDVTTLQHRLPEDRWSIVGAVGVKYDPRNPANSIVISESWTGLRQQKGAVSLPRDQRP
jgi:LPXTG-motif cell wall-anchored protein